MQTPQSLQCLVFIGTVILHSKHFLLYLSGKEFTDFVTIPGLLKATKKYDKHSPRQTINVTIFRISF